jgi:hypothetical protein
MLAVDLYYYVFFSRVTDCICFASTLLRSSYCFFQSALDWWVDTHLFA